MDKMYPEIQNLIVQLNPGADNYQERKNKLYALDAALKNIGSEKGRKYMLSKTLNDPKWNFNAEDFKGLEDYWSLKHQEDYTPPDIEKSMAKMAKEDQKNFWNWDSDKSWRNKSVSELKRWARNAGYGNNLPAFMNDVQNTQILKNREKALAGPYGSIGLLQGILTPRTYEARLRGEDESTKDIGLDVLENALYAYNPAGKVAKAALLAKTARPGIGILAENLLNPLTMEVADKMAYDTGDRSEFSEKDIGLGTLINLGVNELSPRVFNSFVKKKLSRKPTSSELADIGNLETRKKLHGDALDNIHSINEQEYLKSMTPFERSELSARELADYLNADIELEKYVRKVNREPSIKELIGDEKLKEAKLGEYLGNKAGDEISDNPYLSKRVVRQGARAMGLGPLGGMIWDSLVKTKANDETEKARKLIELLGGK